MKCSHFQGAFFPADRLPGRVSVPQEPSGALLLHQEVLLLPLPLIQGGAGALSLQTPQLQLLRVQEGHQQRLLGAEVRTARTRTICFEQKTLNLTRSISK